MADLKVMAGTKLLILIGNGASPTEVFAHPCLINLDRDVDFSADVSSEVIPDCEAPEDPGWKENTIDGLQCTVSGAGKHDTATAEEYFNWFTSGATKNVRIKQDVTAGNGGGYWSAAMNLTNYKVSGSRGQKASSSLTLVSSGAVTWTDAS